MNLHMYWYKNTNIHHSVCVNSKHTQRLQSTMLSAPCPNPKIACMSMHIYWWLAPPSQRLCEWQARTTVTENRSYRSLPPFQERTALKTCQDSERSYRLLPPMHAASPQIGAETEPPLGGVIGPVESFAVYHQSPRNDKCKFIFWACFTYAFVDVSGRK